LTNRDFSSITSCSGDMKIFILIISIALLTLHTLDCRAQDGTDRERILEVIGRIDEAYGKLRSYACDIEGIYFVSGRESERYVFRFYFRKPNLFRIEFQRPYPGMTIFYTQGEMDFIARPLAAFPSVQFRFSVDNPLFKTPSGQGVSQMHLYYFLEFLRQNARTRPQKGADFRRDSGILSFWINATDYVTGKLPERYRMHINTGAWLPDHFERFDLAGNPLEFTIFTNYRINPALDRAFFDPWYMGPASTPPVEPVRP
jgi:outer membrane lipoprotein-sorting protein